MNIQVNGEMGYFLNDADYSDLLQAQQTLSILRTMLYELHQSTIALNPEQLGCLLDYPATVLGNILNKL